MENKLKNNSIKSFKIQNKNSNKNLNLNNIKEKENKTPFIQIYFKSKISPSFYKTYI